MMRKFYSAFRSLIYIIVITLIMVYILGYTLLSIPGIQDKVKGIGTKELSYVLGAEVSIDRIQISPFYKLELFGAHLPDQKGDTLLYANKIAAGISLSDLLFDKELVLTNIQLFGLDARITQEHPDSCTNLQFVLDAFKSKNDAPKEPLKFRINSAIIRRGKIRYDLLSEVPKPYGTFDSHHIEIKNLLAKFSIKALTKDSVNVSLKRLSFDERSGFALNRLKFKVEGNRNHAQLSDFEIQLPHSQITAQPLTVQLPDSIAPTPENIYRQAQFHWAMQVRVNPVDLAAFVPSLRGINTPVTLSTRLSGTPDDFTLPLFDLNIGEGNITIHSRVKAEEIADAQTRKITCDPITLNAAPEELSTLAKALNLSNPIQTAIAGLGNIHFDGDIANIGQKLTACGLLQSDLGSIHSDIIFRQEKERNLKFYSGLVESPKFNLNGLFAEGNPFGEIIFKVEVDSRQAAKQAPTGKLIGKIDHFEYSGYAYKNINLNGEFGNNTYQGTAEINDPNGQLSVNGLVALKKRDSKFDLTIRAREIGVTELNLLPQYPNSKTGFNMTAQFVGNNLDNAEGTISLDSLTFTRGNDSFMLDRFCIEARNQATPQNIVVTSDYLNGWIEGNYRFSTLKKSLQNLLSDALPSVFPVEKKPIRDTKKKEKKEKQVEINDFRFHFTVEPNVQMARILELPITFTDRATIEGYMNSQQNSAQVVGNLPYLWYKKRRIEDAAIKFRKNSDDMILNLSANTYNKKDVCTTLSVRSKAKADNVDLIVNWNNNTQSTFYGELNTSTTFSRSPEDEKLRIHAHINPSTLILNDTVWEMKPSDILYCDKRIEVRDFEVAHDPQYIFIDGVASNQEDDELAVHLNDVNLDYIFGTLNIKNVVFGGNATGKFLATHLLSGVPRLSTERFNVKDFSYNNAIFGDLHLFSQWNNENQGILLKGSVRNKEERSTYIDGYIFPTQDSLSLSFNADRLNGEFLRPFISGIMGDITGVVSGDIDFYGNFKALTVAGDGLVEDFNFGISYLNTHYFLTDSIHMTPERIWFDNVTVYDRLGHTAIASGELRHRHFKDLSFDIAINDAQDFLSYDVTERQSPVYYGTIYGTGSAHITGGPGQTLINVNMATGDQSTFTFVLSGNDAAGDYDFITFTNSKKEKIAQTEIDSTAIKNNALMADNLQAQNSSVLDIVLQVEATNQARVNLVMDKSTGDMIKATGNGNIRLEYNSLDDAIKLYGTYTLEKGNYNFSLQDIITRDFSIREGGQVKFQGDPMATSLDISAIYSLTASLLDLDENFANDKDVSQTSVRVQTLLNIDGDVRKPDLSFGLEFPTLTQDVVSRIHSIINTDDMMNRQIIYLLALNRFYTPDYMNMGQTRNNGLVSVASSTLSSQLGNILGQLSENWNIAPNFRSEKGDFSDMEVELALSSQLLNNRLIFNGNFGYRDNPINNNTFIGDFDLEYLLNKSGTIRLKAYNHYNDRNYYIKSSLTTQGVGIMLRNDFDRWSNFFKSFIRNKSKKKKEKVKNEENTLPTDSTRVK